MELAYPSGLDQSTCEHLRQVWQTWYAHCHTLLAALPSQPVALPWAYPVETVAQWQAFFTPVTESVDIAHVVFHIQFRYCWQQGMFRHRGRAPQQSYDDIAHALLAICSPNTTADAIADGVVRAGVVRSREAARRILRHLMLSDYAAVVTATDTYHTTILLPLARQLGIEEEQYRHTVGECLQRGWFDRPVMHYSVPVRPTLDDVYPSLTAILAEHAFAGQREQAVHASNLCEAQHVAPLVASLETVPRSAAQTLATMLKKTRALGAVGLLVPADYPWVTVVQRLETWRGAIATMPTVIAPDTVMDTVRGDVVALATCLHQRDEAHQAREAHKRSERARLRLAHGAKAVKRRADLAPVAYAVLWREDLAFQPIHSAARVAYQNALDPATTETIVAELAQLRACDNDTARTIFRQFITAGLAGMVDWRAGSTTFSDGVLWQRIRQSMGKHLQQVQQHYRDEIEAWVRALHTVCEEHGIPVALFRLIDDQPGTTYRYAFRRLLNGNKKIIAACAQHMGCSQEDASARLYAFATYGSPGLLRLRTLPSASYEDPVLLANLIDPRITTFIHFHKLQHPQTRSGSQALYHIVQTYARQLGLPVPSLQITRALYNRQPKPPHWNIGQGTTTAPFKARRALAIRRVPRIHTAWLVLPVRLPHPVVIANGYPQGHCYCTLVLDRDSVLPLGCWVSSKKPTAPEVGLALYQSIWHVGNVDWELRGVPETVYISNALWHAGDEHAGHTDLKRAALYLNTRITEIPHDPHWDKYRIVRMLQTTIATIARGIGSNNYVTARAVHDRVLAHLRETFFATHQLPDIPQPWRSKGYAAPAYDSPAAGWLLPAQPTPLQTVRDGVRCQGMLYRGLGFTCEPGDSVIYRMFPYEYAGLQRGLFIQQDTHLYYLQSVPEDRHELY